MLKSWSAFQGYKEYVFEQQRFEVVSGWGGYFLRKKLKFIKGILKIWRQNHASNIKNGLKGSDSFDQEEALLHTGSVIYDVKLKGLRFFFFFDTKEGKAQQVIVGQKGLC